MKAWFCTHFWKDKVNITKNIKMVSITSIETKLVPPQKKKKSQITIAQIVWLLDLESELDLNHPVTKQKMRTWVLSGLA